jgi:glycosyltransferase involved in cell wall biosynthesis
VSSKKSKPTNSHGVIFLYTGGASPAMLDMVLHAHKAELKPLLVLFDRPQSTILLDQSLVDYEIVRIPVRYRSVEFRRFLALPGSVRRINSIIRTDLCKDGTVITNSFDMLLIVRIVGLFYSLRIRHQVRDLHRLQLGDSFLCKLFRGLEKWMLGAVAKVIVSSPRFGSDYYSKIFEGEIVLLENMPLKKVWEGFEKEKHVDEVFLIGYVGVLRYKESLYQLVDAVEKLAEEGFNLKVFFAGGGMECDVNDVYNRASKKELFEFSGPYEYARDIKKLYSRLDLIYAIYDSANANCQLAMPNKFYESMLSSTPILVAKNTFVGEETERLGIGVTVDLGSEGDLDAKLKSALEKKSWYRKALDNLGRLDTSSLFADYESAIRKSVL